MVCKRKIIIASSIDNEYEKAEEHLGGGWKPIAKDAVEFNLEKDSARENIHFQNKITGEKKTLRFDISSFFFKSGDQQIAEAKTPEQAARLQVVNDITNKLLARLGKTGKKK